MTSPSLALPKQRENSWFPHSILMEESYQINLLESDASAYRSKQDSRGTEDLNTTIFRPWPVENVFISEALFRQHIKTICLPSQK